MYIIAEKYNSMTQSVKAEGLGESALDDSLINLTGTILEFVCSFIILLIKLLLLNC